MKRKKIITWEAVANELNSGEWGKESFRSPAHMICNGSNDDMIIALLLDISKSLRRIKRK